MRDSRIAVREPDNWVKASPILRSSLDEVPRLVKPLMALLAVSGFGAAAVAGPLIRVLQPCNLVETIMPMTRSARSAAGLARLYPPEAIFTDLQATTKQGVLKEMVHRLVLLGRIASDAEEPVAQAILARENLGSTGMQNIAIPSHRLTCLEEYVGAAAILPAGLDFAAIDGEPVYAVFLLLIPQHSREQHFQILGRLMAIGLEKWKRLRLRGCRSAQEVHRFFQELDRSRE